MRLRNKKTGEILGNFGSFIIQNPNGINCEAITKYNSLAELNEEWEDAPEEPKGYWFIDSLGEVHEHTKDTQMLDIEQTAVEDWHLNIGNYFETREEAEKAVEKLKALKRLKDNGFEFDGIRLEGSNCLIKTKLKDDTGVTFDHAQQFYEDVVLLFGGIE